MCALFSALSKMGWALHDALFATPPFISASSSHHGRAHVCVRPPILRAPCQPLRRAHASALAASGALPQPLDAAAAGFAAGQPLALDAGAGRRRSYSLAVATNSVAAAAARCHGRTGGRGFPLIGSAMLLLSVPWVRVASRRSVGGSVKLKGDWRRRPRCVRPRALFPRARKPTTAVRAARDGSRPSRGRGRPHMRGKRQKAGSRATDGVGSVI